MQVTEKGKVLTGARIRISAQGIKIGYATGLRINEQIAYEPVEVCDNIEVAEHVPTRYRVSGSLDFVRVVTVTPKASKLFPSGGVSAEERLKNILTNGDLVLTAEDRGETPNRIIAKLEQVKFGDNNMNISATGMVGSDMSFVAIRVRDESEN